ncbi:MAG: YCF48-related protein [Ignavibacteria bacterium]|nr:YCF48-related protein [Ignavibacteria bacterium]
MKKLIITSLFFLITYYSLLISNCQSQWIQQYTGTTSNLYDMKFLNERTGWVVGASGALMKTTNAGVNWVQMGYPVGNKPLRGIHIVDSNIVYVVGYYETIIKTTNGGSNWIIIRNGPSSQGESYFCVFFIDKDKGWIAGTGEKVLKTTDGGETIDSAYVNGGWFYDMYFKDANTGCMSEEGRVFKTTNGGINWYPSLSASLGHIFMKISFVDNLYGWVCSLNGRAVYRTIDFGSNWSLIDTTVPGMGCIHFINKDTGFMGGNTNRLYKSTNSGFSWRRENTVTSNEQFEAIKFVNDTVGWVAATTGVILHTTKGGQPVVNISQNGNEIPKGYRLNQNYPNPFNSTTRIPFEISEKANINISVFDILGRKIETIVNKTFEAGKYEVSYNADKLSSGIYFYRMLIDGNTSLSNKFLLKK